MLSFISFLSFVADGRPHHLCFLQAGRCRVSSPELPSRLHRHCPSPSFQQLLWAPGSCQKSFSSQSPTGASQWEPRKTMTRGGVRPMSDTHSCALSGGKVYSESMNVSIFKSLRLEKRSKATTLETMPSCTNTVPSSGETNWICSQHCWPRMSNFRNWSECNYTLIYKRAHKHARILLHKNQFSLIHVARFSHSGGSQYAALMPVTPRGWSLFLSALISPFPSIAPDVTALTRCLAFFLRAVCHAEATLADNEWDKSIQYL